MVEHLLEALVYSRHQIHWAEWHLLVISALSGEKKNNQKSKVILRLQRKSKNTKGLVHPQPPKKGEQPRTAPTFNLVRHIHLPSLLSLSHVEEEIAHLKLMEGSSSKECPPPFQGELTTHTKACRIGALMCFGTLAPPGPLPASRCCGDTRGLAQHPGKETAALPGAP